ncbi:MAG TPA: FmdB family zinc ribbon protein [Armatimonadota bacterium]|jgi:putative FmdB family regulatory protein
MPLYEYACLRCDHHFDVRHGANEVPELACPECQGAVKKVFHVAGIIFKGSGWHIKDYASKSDQLAESAAEKAETKTEVKAATPAAPAAPAASTPTPSA